MTRTVAVVTSVRAHSLEHFYAAWGAIEPQWDDLVVVEDGQRLVTRHQPPSTYVIDDEVMAKWLGPLKTDALTVGDSARKSYGFAFAVEELDADVVISLDDDCLPDRVHGPEFRARHEDAILRTPRYASSVPGRPVRGLPYGEIAALDVAVNMGFWDNVPDDDAVMALAASRTSGGVHPIDRGRVDHTRVMPSHQYWPFCGMNFAADRGALAGLYFPKQGSGVPYRRFDDIWCGTILQRACRHLGLSLSAGPPFVNHSRASDPVANLVKEAPGIAANQVFWWLVDSVDLGDAADLATAVRRIAEGLAEPKRVAEANAAHHGFGGYLSRLSGWIGDWLALVERVESRTCSRPTSTRSPSSRPIAAPA